MQINRWLTLIKLVPGEFPLSEKEIPLIQKKNRPEKCPLTGTNSWIGIEIVIIIINKIIITIIIISWWQKKNNIYIYIYYIYIYIYIYKFTKIKIC